MSADRFRPVALRMREGPSDRRFIRPPTSMIPDTCRHRAGEGRKTAGPDPDGTHRHPRARARRSRLIDSLVEPGDGLDKLARDALECFRDTAVVTGQPHEGYELTHSNLVIGPQIVGGHFGFIWRDDDFDFRHVAAGFRYQLAQRGDLGRGLLRVQLDTEPP